jgi:hypothetical protein
MKINHRFQVEESQVRPLWSKLIQLQENTPLIIVSAESTVTMRQTWGEFATANAHIISACAMRELADSIESRMCGKWQNYIIAYIGNLPTRAEVDALNSQSA